MSSARASHSMRIATAALRTEDGRVFTLPRPARHHDVMQHMHDRGISPHGCEQGFVTECGQWVRRQPALRIARNAGQIVAETAPAHGLFSEDVW